MSFKGILCGVKDGFGILLSGFEGRHWGTRTRPFIAPDIVAHSEPNEQGEWANLPPELLLEIIRRVEESETSWPARRVVVFCASVCKSWRDITKEIVKTPEECGRLTFPISLKQRGPKGNPIQCYIKRDRATSTYRLYFGLMPSAGEPDKLLLAAKRLRRPTSTDFMISLVADDFSRSSETFVGKLRSNFMGTKFTIYDRHQIPKSNNSKQISPKLPTFYHSVATVSYELNVLRKRGPRRMCCTIPVSTIQEDDGTKFLLSNSERVGAALVLKNKAPRWHEQLQCWCLNFRGRVTVASVKNFQLVASVDSSSLVELPNSEEVILQLGKIGKDIFTMDYLYPLSAFQAFAICLSSFDTKPACE